MRPDMRPTLLLMLLALMSPRAAQATDGGELSLGAGIDFGLADIYNPFAQYPTGSGGAAEALSFTSILVDFGLTDHIAIGAGVRASVPVTTTAYGVGYGRFGPGNLQSSVMSVLIPLRFVAQYTNGTNFGWTLAFEGGLDLSRWSMQAFDDPAVQLSDPTFFLRSATQWSQHAYARAAIACQWRPFDHAAFTGGPFFQKTFAGGWLAGIMLQGEFFVGAAPSFEN